MTRAAASGRRLAWAIAIPVVAAYVIGLAAFVAAGGSGSVLLYATYGGAGLFLVARRPAQPIGWLLVLIGVGLGWALLPVTATLEEALSGHLSLASAIALWGNGVAFAPVFIGLTCLALLFPDGHLPGGRARPIAIATLAGGAALAGLIAVNPLLNVQLAGRPTTVDVPNPFAAVPTPLAPFVPDTGTLYSSAFGLVAIALAGLLLRYRASCGLARLQYRWLVWSLLCVVVATGVWAVATMLVPVDTIGVTLFTAMLAYAAVPIAIGIAVLRYRLYEIDRIISRTIGWAITSGTIVAVFAILVVGLQALLAPLTGEDTLAVAASTLVAAALFAPLRSRVQRAADRRFDRARYDAERIAAALAERLRDQTDLAAIHGDVLAAVDGSLRPARVGLWVREE